LALLKKLFAEARDYLREIFRETIVIFDLEGEFAGVIVDEVLEVREIRREQIKQVTAEDYLDEKYMEGTAILGDHVILLMDIFKIAKA
jgi:chemotaxis signal transduction protein